MSPDTPEAITERMEALMGPAPEPAGPAPLSERELTALEEVAHEAAAQAAAQVRLDERIAAAQAGRPPAPWAIVPDPKPLPSHNTDGEYAFLGPACHATYPDPNRWWRVVCSPQNGSDVLSDVTLSLDTKGVTLKSCTVEHDWVEFWWERAVHGSPMLAVTGITRLYADQFDGIDDVAKYIYNTILNQTVARPALGVTRKVGFDPADFVESTKTLFHAPRLPDGTLGPFKAGPPPTKD